MELLCLMGLHPVEFEKELIKNSKSGMQIAANKFQWGIVNGITDADDVHLTILNSMYLGSFPRRYRKPFIPTFKFQHKAGADDLNIGYTNLTIYKAFSRYVGIKREIDRWIQNNSGSECAVLAYAMTTPFVEILHYIKDKYPQVKCCLVVPDLPEYMNVSQRSNPLYKKLKQIQRNHFQNCLKDVDGYIFLTDAMKDWFNYKVKYTVVEGISLIQQSDLSVSVNNKKRQILYAGMIEKRYGVVDLVKAFHEIPNSDWQLHLYGGGTAVAEIRNIASTDNRIIIHGVVPNAEVLNAQKNSEILVNPRNDNNEFTKYSFPSKVIEYLGSGTPMVGYILPGMPAEYHDKFYVVPSGPNGLKKCLSDTMNLSSEERQKKGKEAQEFIYREKNAKAQGKKIANFIMTL